MAKRDYDRAASRFLIALRRITNGLITQQQRILDRAANAPRLHPDVGVEIVNLCTDPGNDLDYYIYELARLSEVGKSIIKIFGQPPELVAAQSAFEDGIPKLREIRDPLTHPNDNDRLDDVAWFSSVVHIRSDGSVEGLVDPRYQHHDYAMTYSQALRTYLRAHVKNAIAANPPCRLTSRSPSEPLNLTSWLSFVVLVH